MKKVLVIVGPTASGKSDLAVKIAKKFKGEVISADSRQVYRSLDIGTGKITKSEMRGVPHHLLDVASPKKQFSASDYKKLAEKKLETINFPIVVGGTGFYIDSLAGISLPEVPPNKLLRNKLEKLSTEKLFELLRKKDPRRAKSIDEHNKVRLVRALEIVETLGKVPSITKFKSPHRFIYIGLLPDNLSARIKKRLIARVPGMIREAHKLHKLGLSYRRMFELGLEYRYLSLYLRNKISKKDFVAQLELAILQYAKRQMTWFKRNKKIKWFEPKEYKEIEKYVSTKFGGR